MPAVNENREKEKEKAGEEVDINEVRKDARQEV